MILENKHGNIWGTTLTPRKRTVLKFRTNNLYDMISFRELIDRTHGRQWSQTNKVVGDMMHHGTMYIIPDVLCD